MSNGFFADSTWADRSDRSVPEAPGRPKCGACGLFKHCRSPKMPHAGLGKRPILIVGEPPDETEDSRNRLFVGDAGEKFRDLAMEAGLDVDWCWQTSALACAPGDEPVKLLHVESCRPKLEALIRELKPNVIVLLGEWAVRAVIGAEWGGKMHGAEQWAGWRIPSERYGVWLCPTYGPTQLQRAKDDKALCRAVRGHLRAAIDLEGVPARPNGSVTLAGLRGAVEPITDLNLARLRLKDLANREGVLAFDYETTGLKPERAGHQIVTASFCLDGEDTFAIPLSPRTRPGDPRELHPELVRPLRKVLQNPRLRKVASNMKFEHRWSKSKLGVDVEGWHWDTMLSAHLHDNREYVTSVKFQTYVHLGVGSYAEWVEDNFGTGGRDYEENGENAFNRIDAVHTNDLLVYNGVDSLVEFKVAEIQKALTGLEGM